RGLREGGDGLAVRGYDHVPAIELRGQTPDLALSLAIVRRERKGAAVALERALRLVTQALPLVRRRRQQRSALLVGLGGAQARLRQRQLAAPLASLPIRFAEGCHRHRATLWHRQQLLLTCARDRMRRIDLQHAAVTQHRQLGLAQARAVRVAEAGL